MTSLLALAVLSVAFGPSPAAPADRAALRVSSRAPLVVRGSLFDSGERITVVANAKGVHRRVVVAGLRGTFVVVFRSVRLDNCDSFIVRATGARGNYGLVRSIPECNPIGPLRLRTP